MCCHGGTKVMADSMLVTVAPPRFFRGVRDRLLGLSTTRRVRAVPRTE
jgi:hypothetical protein